MFPVLQQFVKFTRSLLTLLQGIFKMKWGYIKKVTIIIIFKNYAHVPPFRPTAIIINHLSPNSDQEQFSPNDIHTLSWDEVMRINKMIT